MTMTNVFQIQLQTVNLGQELNAHCGDELGVPLTLLLALPLFWLE